MNRRQVFSGVAAAATGTATGAFLLSRQGAKRPNFLIVIADDLRWDSIGALGNRAAQTPELDGLAYRGRVFSNAFVTTSICPTSRASILTGQYGRRHGVWSFDKALTAAQMQQAYPSLLRANGYQTGFVGKWGIGNELPTDAFDFFRGILGQGTYYDAANGGRHLGDVFREQALEGLSGFKADDPFCLILCSKEVHEQDEDTANPYQPMAKFSHLYENVTFPSPATANVRSFEKLPPFVRTSLGRTRWEPRFSTEQLFQKSMRAYHQLLTGLDDICGDIVKMLEQKGVLDDTVIIVTSDNGNMLGDHGLAAKWFMFEESIRVPLIVSAPERFGFGAGSVDRSVALNVDIAPTILALAGIPVPAGMQGRPLLEPAESRPSLGIAREFLYEHLLEIPNLPKSEGVRTSRFKYVKYLVEGGDYESLFDLTNDPFEETDLARTETGQQLLPDMRLKLSSLVAEAA